MTIKLYSLLFPMIKKRLDVLNRGLEDNSGDLQEPLHHSDRRQGLDQQLLYMNNYLQNKQAELCSDLQLLSELSSAIAFRVYCRGKQCIYRYPCVRAILSLLHTRAILYSCVDLMSLSLLRSRRL